MIDIITSFFLLVIYSIRYLFSTGENRKQAKADLKEFWADTDANKFLTKNKSIRENKILNNIQGSRHFCWMVSFLMYKRKDTQRYLSTL
ncbi:hypothetical protein [Bacillus sp. MMSF_3353]|uniref:hypothetical protein n=1 Tax=Bacillus sp. MMSF_3353 TaxID=3047081 RepID=UPI00273E90FB|nr:hypothetical protein [Bacillus sp. MMSF_3353]